MTRNEEIISAAAADLYLEGMEVTEEEKQAVMDCLTGKRKFSDLYEEIKSRYENT